MHPTRTCSSEPQRPLTVCVAIPTYSRESVLVDTVSQVLDQQPAPDEVLVIDQSAGHEESTANYFEQREREGRLTRICLDRPNLNCARNAALFSTRCDIVVFIDDDVRLSPGFIEHHRRNYAAADVVAVAGRTIQARGCPPMGSVMPWTVPLGYPCFALDSQDRAESVAAFIGANHSVRTKAARAIGGYDENYFGPLYNENDLAIRLCREGGRIVFDPDAEVLHYQMSVGGVRGNGSDRQPEYWMSYSSVYFHLKHFFPTWYFWKQVGVIEFRRRVLHRENIVHPWRLPHAIVCYGYAAGLAIRNVVSRWLRTCERRTQRGWA